MLLLTITANLPSDPHGGKVMQNAHINAQATISIGKSGDIQITLAKHAAHNREFMLAMDMLRAKAKGRQFTTCGGFIALGFFGGRFPAIQGIRSPPISCRKAGHNTKGKNGMETIYHEGPVQIRFYKKWISILCPLGHSVSAVMLDENWGGSAIESQIANHQHGSIPWTVKCYGALPKYSAT